LVTAMQAHIRAINPFINRQTFLLTPGIEDDSHLA
jgi:hypothetical protein